MHKRFRIGHRWCRIWPFYFVREWNVDDKKKNKNVKCKSLPNCRYATEFHFGYLCRKKWKNQNLSFKRHYTRCAHKYLVHLNGPFIYAENGVNSEGVWCHDRVRNDRLSRNSWVVRLNSESKTDAKSIIYVTSQCIHCVDCSCVNAVAHHNHWTITFIGTSIITWHWRRWVLQLVTGSSWHEWLDFNILFYVPFFANSNHYH